jgi:hypothetical protein
LIENEPKTISIGLKTDTSAAASPLASLDTNPVKPHFLEEEKR